jgi:hypothetical protein
MEKKKLIRVEDWPGSDSVYSNSGIMFSFVTRATDAEDIITRRQSTQFFTCRDHVNDALRAHVHQRHNGVYDYGTNPPIDMEKMRMLVRRDCKKESFDKYRERVFSAKRVLNFYENAASWPLSKVTTVKMKKKKNVAAWLITGPKQWVSYSQLMSMVTLIFRVISNYGPIEFTDNNDIERWFGNLVEKYDEDVESGIFQQDPDLNTYLPHSLDKFHMLVTRYDDIFTQSVDEAYPAEGNVHSAGGVYHLCSFQSSANPTLDKNMSAVWEDYCIQKQKNKVRKVQEKITKACENAYKISKPSGL